MARVLLTVFLLIFAQSAWAQTLHALIVADTTAVDLDPGAERSMKRAENFVLDVGRHTGMEVKHKVVAGTNLSKDAVWQAVNGIAPGPDDTVILYYVGHGTDSAGGALPDLAVGSTHSGSVDANSVVNVLEGKGQRLLVALFEACNQDRASLSVDDATMMAGFASPRERYTAFFKEARGSFVASAAVEGEWAYLSSNFGGHFTHKFMQSLAGSDSWDQLASVMRQSIEIQKPLGASRAILQTPYVRASVQMQTAVPPPPPQPIPTTSARPKMVSIADWISVADTPVTVAQFEDFVDATGYNVQRGCRAPTFGGAWPVNPTLNWRNPGQWQTDTHPVVCVSHEDAVAYAQWLGREQGARYGLMPLNIWEYLAQQTNPSVHAICSDCALPAPEAQPVASTAPSGKQIYDVLGNVWQWLDDCSGSKCELRGGAWLDDARILQARELDAERRGFRTVALGFRVVRYD